MCYIDGLVFTTSHIYYFDFRIVFLIYCMQKSDCLTTFGQLY